MQNFIPLLVGIIALGVGAILGYYLRQSLVKKRAGNLEKIVQEKISKAKRDSENLISEAKKKALGLVGAVKREEEDRRRQLYKTEQVLLKRENILDQKISNYEKKERDFLEKVEKLKKIKESLEDLRQESLRKLEEVSKLSQEEAKKELIQNVEQDYQREILGKIKKLEEEGRAKLEKRAKEILSFAIQKYGLSQAQEITTTTVSLPSEEIKGRIIGKEGRNIRTLEKLTGVEIVVDETPETVLISGFDPIRRQIAKTALEKLIEDGRIQPARIEEIVERTKEEISAQIKEAGEQAIYETGLVGLSPKLVNLLGRLKFRTSYGQNVLLHSIEVSHLAGALAAEIGAKIGVCKKAGLLHDIGKSVDQQIEGSHVDIGIKILEKFDQEKEVICAMKSHHEDYPYESIEAVLIQTADQISGARPGARKDTLENYLKRLEDLEEIATSFAGVKTAWALHAGKEIRVFVKPEEIDDLGSYKLAKDIANKIQEELRYPGEIKVTLIRENRVVEYAK
ncbi:MAG: ribonuclease Y [Candidatus Nealsonbacteria bacterium CG_4_9_14_0_2_um_filter_37_38]|uniref:Ribonuclease Y n=1 Tax=Candidatus Nealsonbacteria bacterium CG_4_10_14_0_8_um_filter_37_14 TaxID=1974684 RepID=A0A2M7R5Y6_9BACT|nr:MAG: ribonuclease Y [Candidatus Nealsonbacteria bacterium CG11_big_fil_rev_8_21_14_0_20_37_68]PIY88511.1 MAG: ribonuclease Y [Candidatus Nealsonbacteria bacterium CG_4_10_14_0_8_um_filter_37_14]PJC51400.1 MAG: ribonuclease Y [Candidatus Nealsonbacteria bacterium CG_4_9_14_0_2_um_filter_37_38]